MSAKRRIEAAIFDMDGLLIDSEPLWDQAEVEVMESLGVDTRRRDELPDLLGLRIDLVVDLWYAQQPWRGVDRAEATARIIRRATELVEASRPLLPGVREAVRQHPRVVAVTPLVRGLPIKGPLDRMLRGLGHEVTMRGSGRGFHRTRGARVNCGAYGMRAETGVRRVTVVPSPS